MFVTRNVFLKFHNPTDGEGNDLGGGAGESGTGGNSGSAAGNAGGAGEGDEGAGEAAAGTKNKPTDAEARLLKEVMEKKNKLRFIEDEKKNLESRLKQFEGIDPEAVRALLKEKQEAETAKLEAKGEWDRLKSQMKDEHQREKAELLEKLKERDTETSSLKNAIAELTVGNAFAQSQFIQSELALTPSKTRVVYGAHFEFKDGVVVAYDKPAGAPNRAPLVNASGDPLSFEEALKKIVDADPDRDQLLKSRARQGAASKTVAKSGNPPDVKTEGFSGKDRIAAALSAGKPF